MRTTLTRIRPNAYEVIDDLDAKPLLIGYDVSGTVWSCDELDAEGLAVRQIGSLDTTELAFAPPSGVVACCIRDDPTVDHGSLAWLDEVEIEGETTRKIRVWSPITGALYEHTVAAGRVSTAPVSGDGWLYWVEMEADASRVWSVYRSFADLSNAHVAATATPDPFGFGHVFEWIPKCIALMSDAIVTAAWWRLLDEEEGVSAARIGFNVPEQITEEHDPIGGYDEFDRATLYHHEGAAYGVVIGTGGDNNGSSFVRLADASDAVTGSHWPTGSGSGAWQIPASSVRHNGDAYAGQGLVYAGDRILVGPIDPPHDAPTLDLTTDAYNLIFLGGG